MIEETHHSTHDLNALLNELIAICRDGEEGYRTAASALDEEPFHTLLLHYAAQRRDFIAALQDQVVRFGGQPETAGDLAGSIHRTWINLKAVVATSDIDAVLAECERGENAALVVYGEAREKHLPADVLALVQDQYQAIRAARDRIRALSVSNKAPAS